MEFSGITRHIYACPETFAPEYFRSLAGVLVRKSCPESQEGGEIQPPGSEWRRSKFGGAVLLRAGATECDESKCSSRLLQPCRMVDSSSSPSSSPSSSSATVQQRCFRGEQKYRLLFFLLPSDFFHSPRHFVLSLCPPSFGGVSCFALLLPHGAAHADPRREGETERLLCAEDRLCLWKITFSRKSCKVGRGKKKKVCLPGAFPSFFFCLNVVAQTGSRYSRAI